MEEKCDCDTHGGFFTFHPFRSIVGMLAFAAILAIIFFVLGSALWGSSYTMSYAHPLLRLFVSIFIFLFLIWIVIWIIRLIIHPHMHGYGHMHGDRAARILRRRYAKGEISETQFKRMMKNLKEGQ